MKLFLIYSLFILSVFFSGCKKVAGSGGTSSIHGKVTGIESAGSSKKEITYITCVSGAIIDDNDYLLINSPGGTNYYVWFDNTNWVGGDPGLAGRTGIKVVYDFTQNNLTVAANMANELQAMAGSDFNVTVSNDIITIECKETGPVTDADDVNSPLIVDIEQQGSSGTSGSSTYLPVADERVYIIYGDEEYYSEDVRTDANGKFQFKGLRKGNYTVFVFSESADNPQTIIQQSVSAEITKNKESVDIGEIQIIK